MPGLDPGIHDLRRRVHVKTWMAGHRRAEATPSFGRLCPATTKTRDGRPGAMLTEASNYDELYRNFRWDIPAHFNIAAACCDRHADGSGRLALIYVDELGQTRRTTFDEVAEMSRRFANVLKEIGRAHV